MDIARQKDQNDDPGHRDTSVSKGRGGWRQRIEGQRRNSLPKTIIFPPAPLAGHGYRKDLGSSARSEGRSSAVQVVWDMQRRKVELAIEGSIFVVDEGFHEGERHDLWTYSYPAIVRLSPMSHSQ